MAVNANVAIAHVWDFSETGVRRKRVRGRAPFGLVQASIAKIPQNLLSALTAAPAPTRIRNLQSRARGIV